MKKNYIYKITNLINNKVYIGQTVNYKRRIQEHFNGRKSGKNSILFKAIKKYGKESFEHEIIDIANTQDDADKLEREYIKLYNSLKPNGYNILIGGRSQQGAWNQRKVYMYNLNGEFEREFESCSELELQSNSFYNHSLVSACCTGNAMRHKDKLFSYEKHDKILPYKKPTSVRCVKVYQFTVNGEFVNEFNSIQDAAEATNTSRTSILGCLKGTYKSANGFIWSNHKECIVPNKNIRRTNIIQLDENMNVVAEYVSCAEAERTLGLKKNAYKVIWKRLNINKLTYGYYWFKKDNPVPSL